ncbi:Versiconal hemiacetal acetate reductase [Hypsizygus marmoreus]|uniref:Versiconal hemiacetal acetate reductase n=1 Tax=Hypsizygus marmoreus TaxID=39966 RepID=A0A369K5L2_HYPMA|nr:Versiconal hemiacetal acetate reductase [Hypsizygus marmoreus]
MSGNAMPYVRLGKSGLKVSKIILGCMSYGSPEWQALPEEQGMEHIKAAYDGGINAFDTANVYSDGLSEVILGKAIKKYNLPREEIVVMTKVYFTMKRNAETIITPKSPETYSYINQKGLSRKHIFDSVKQSLERLQLDYIDVLQCHRFDLETPIEETMQALHDVVQAGYVRYIGMSSCWAWQCELFYSLSVVVTLNLCYHVLSVHAMQNYAIQNRLTSFISMQNHYNLAYREEEREMIPTLKFFGVGCIPWSPLARGLLTRPVSQERQTTRAGSDQHFDGYEESSVRIIERVEATALRRGVSMAQIALAWLMNKEGVTSPVVGTTSLDKLRELIDAVHIKLNDEEMKELEELYKPQPTYGHM